MSPKQEQYYWRLWGSVRKAQPGLDRKELHARLGLPESHQAFGQKHFDAFIAGCKAITNPGDMDAQIRQEQMGRTRLKVSIGHLLDALQKPEAYAVAIVRRMNEHGRIGQPLEPDRAYVRDEQKRKVYFDYAHTEGGEPARQHLTLEDLDELELGKVITALKKECKRHWPTKEKLLGALAHSLNSPILDRRAAGPALLNALNVDRVPDPERCDYETIVVMLGVLNRLHGEPAHSESVEA